jgi:ribosomal protein L29
MKYKDLQNKSDKELQKNLKESRDKVRDMRFRVAQRQLKKVSGIKSEKKNISQILTEINKRKNK